MGTFLFSREWGDYFGSGLQAVTSVFSLKSQVKRIGFDRMR